MPGRSRWTLACVLVVGALAIGVADRLLAAEAPAPVPQPGEVAPAPVPTPEEQAARDLLKRYEIERKVQDDQKRFLAEQHVKVGNAHFNNQAWEEALRQYEQALQLDEKNKGAQEGVRKAESMLGIAKKRFGDLAADYARQRAIALEVQKVELANLRNTAMALFTKGDFVDAVGAFTHVSARARYLSPNIDVGKIAEEADVYIQKSMQAIDKKRQEDEATRLKRAETEAKDLRERRLKLFDERTQALYRQATTLFEEGRYEQARTACDEILLQDPANGAAESLRESAVDAARNQFIEHAIKARRVETERHWQETRAYSVPYTEVRPYMERDQFEKVRSRKAETSIGGTRSEPQPWEMKIRESMNKKISFDFVETPLQDVIAFISSLADVTIVLDTEAVKDEPHSVTLRVNDMRLQSALNWVLKLVGLKYTLKDEAIFISKAERIRERPELRMYDVTDLTIDIKNFQGRQQALASDSGYSSTGSTGGGGDSMAQDFFGNEDENTEEDRLTGETLVDFIRKTIAPGSWSDDGGVGAEF